MKKIMYASLQPTGTVNTSGEYCEWEWIESNELEHGEEWNGNVQGCVENLIESDEFEIADGSASFAIHNFPANAVLLLLNGSPAEIYWAAE